MRIAAWLILTLSFGCGVTDESIREPAVAEGADVSWALAIHGGAGVIPRSMEPERAESYRLSLENALRLGSGMLDEGGRALDAVERVIRLMEDDPLFNAGRGAVFNHEAGHELDASIMDGRTLECGAVTGVTTVKNPIGLARRVMERTDHVLLSGAGAERFADEMGVDRVDPSYFSTERRRRQLESKQTESAATREHGTVGVVALDRHGDLAAGTSTGGLTDKLYGRVGDTPIVGAGTFADNASCAVSATGRGEEFIRHGVALTVCRIVQREGRTLEAAAREVIHEVLEPGDGGIIAVDAGGRLVLEFNTEGMYRGSADSSGRFDVEIWR